MPENGLFINSQSAITVCTTHRYVCIYLISFTHHNNMVNMVPIIDVSIETSFCKTELKEEHHF